jgi:predicted TIM-barrel fold metal-dependent hydrolase
LIIDIHAHCFPDDIARRALPGMEAAAGVKAALDGTLGELLRSMDGAGIDLAVAQHIATRPGQEKAINKWAREIQGERMLCFGTIHPDSPDWRDAIKRMADEGFKGVKFHGDYQDFFVAAPRMFPIYEALCAAGLIVLFHAGIDIGRPDPCHCPPGQLRAVVERFPEGRWIAAHMGGYLCWDEVGEHLAGLPLYFDTSYCYPRMGAAGMRAMIRAHGAERILFGSDSPWEDQAAAVGHIRELGLSVEEEGAVLGGNALALLGLSPKGNRSATDEGI